MRSPRLDSLTGLRFPAALAVFAFHAALHAAPGSIHDVASAVAGRGYVGVSFFFVLSGFVLTWSHGDADTPRAFYRRRFARIAPVYWLCLAAAVLLISAAGGDPVGTVRDSLASAVGLQAWFPAESIHYAANGPGWSISAEMFFYASFPLLIVGAASRRGRVVLAVTALLLAVGPALVLRPTDSALDSGAAWLLYVFPLTRIADFIVGILLAKALLAGWRSSMGLTPALLLAAAAYVVTGYVPVWATVNLVTLVPFALVIAAAATADLDGRPTPWRTVRARRLGEWSFAFYLVHGIVLRVQDEASTRLGLPAVLEWLSIGLALVVSLAVARIIYERVEAPLEKRLRHAPARATLES